MEGYLEVWGEGGASVVMLDDRAVLGRAPGSDVLLADDRTVSRSHAVIERYGSGWSVRDLGSANGTFVNGERIYSDKALRTGDEVRVGSHRLVYRLRAPEGSAGTARIEERPPVLTRREREVLISLCRPLVGTQPFAQPAAISDISGELFISQAAVKYHLSSLYDKFDITEPGSNRRAELANAAMATGAVTVADLRTPPGDAASSTT